MDGTVDVDGGRVRGREEGGIWAFLGVRYAGAPVGALRWRPPVRPETWSGVRDADEPGPLAPQGAAAPGGVLPGDPVHQSEDCLHLSVWTPGIDGARRPVMVWVHGGGFTSGTAGSSLYRGDRLARRGDVVVVSVNYRLGAFGFLAHPALASPGPPGLGGFGNWGLLDVVAALRWVRDHISGFGGDPQRVTLFGESAGAMAVSSLMVMPAARGLFRRVVLQSGPPYVQSAARAADAATAFVGELGLDEVDRDVLEEVPASELVAATTALSRRPPRPGELPLPLLPAVDGSTLPSSPLDAVRQGGAAGIEAVIGTNRDEIAFFGLSDKAMAALDEDGLRRRIAQSAPASRPDAVVEAYRRVRTGRGELVTPRDIWVAAASDLVFRWPSLQLAAALDACGGRAFVYFFTWETPAFDGVLGACHGLDIPFVFGTVRDPVVAVFAGSGPDAEGLSDGMQAAWAAFARDGDPSNPHTGPWPAWDAARRTTMVFGRTTEVRDGPRDEELSTWEPLFPLMA